jgi:NAD(P)H-flavin reductase
VIGKEKGEMRGKSPMRGRLRAFRMRSLKRSKKRLCMPSIPSQFSLSHKPSGICSLKIKRKKRRKKVVMKVCHWQSAKYLRSNQIGARF